ncbi:tail protein [Shigella sonnei]|nr:tail protein [Shigella sonnei]SIZ67694.1 tail protein [Shigella sonnei]SIZ99693.1 tail protein [Shigella sonnei]SJA10103.1 tail protein [Shigella sonnei]SJA38362.1 tail protein [Shigella sonnei]
MKTLDIRVAFSAVDRLTRPAENARRLMGQFGDSIQRTQGAIKNLERHGRVHLSAPVTLSVKRMRAS